MDSPFRGNDSVVGGGTVGSYTGCEDCGRSAGNSTRKQLPPPSRATHSPRPPRFCTICFTNEPVLLRCDEWVKFCKAFRRELNQEMPRKSGCAGLRGSRRAAFKACIARSQQRRGSWRHDIQGRLPNRPMRRLICLGKRALRRARPGLAPYAISHCLNQLIALPDDTAKPLT